MPNLRKLLYPFSLLYDGITRLRNGLYTKGLLDSQAFELPVICVGNLSVGGTGKTPMVEYLLGLFHVQYKLATLSRGYKRKSRGFQLVEKNTHVSVSGDEPLQFKNKFPEVLVAVDANRIEGIKRLQQFSPEIIILDDAFQHRKVTAGFYILLSSYGDLYSDDLVLPAGNLRESAKSAERADIIVVTKCPDDLSVEEMQMLEERLKPLDHQKLFFTSISYSEKIVSKTEEIEVEKINAAEFTLVTGIANPQPLVNFLSSKAKKLPHLKFPDHHSFTSKEIEDLKERKKIITSEKDFMRLKEHLPPANLFYLPIKTEFLKGGKVFENEIRTYINKK